MSHHINEEVAETVMETVDAPLSLSQAIELFSERALETEVGEDIINNISYENYICR